jgi:hypothetical protein
MSNAVDRSGRSLYRTGGISALALGVAYIVIIALYVRIGAPPKGTEPRLVFLAQNTTVWWVILGLSVLTDFLFLPVAVALYVILKEVNRNMVLLATACVILFIVLDLAITWTNYAALITLSDKYARAASAAQKAAVVATADYATLVVESSLLFVYNTLVLSVGILLTGFIMLNGIFGNRIAHLGLVTGILGVVSVVGPFLAPAMTSTIILTSVLTTIWVLLLGYRLYRLGRH